MFKHLPLKLFISFSLLLFNAILTFCSAHSSDINKANLSIENPEQYHLTITVDILHLLKQYQGIDGDDNKVARTLKSMSFSEQKLLLDSLHKDLTQQTHIRFTRAKSNQKPNEEHIQEGSFEHNIGKLSGLSLSQLKKILTLGPEIADTHVKLLAKGDIPLDTNSLAIRFSPLFSAVQLTIVRPQHDLVSAHSYSESFQVNMSSHESSVDGLSSIRVITDYIVQGFVHILPRGLDHILFVLALFLFAKSRSSLIWQVSTFTFAHTITLALGIYGIVQLPSAVVEPLIALSIIYVALENFYGSKSATISRTRMPVIFAFGLLHGLGFASVLRDVGLPESQYALSLLSFNVGVELGQLSVIAIAFLCLAPVMKKSWYQSRLVKALNVIIAIIAIYWLIERVF